MAGIFIGTALLAIAPFLVRSPSRALFMICVAPQQFLLLLHFASATTTVLIGQYPDGYIPEGGMYFIFVDQIWLLMICIWHLIEYIRAL